jgi:hypothetical protein
MMNGLGLKATISAKDFEKEMHGIGYPFKVYELPSFEYREYGSYVPFLLTNEAIATDYRNASYYGEEGDLERASMCRAQADMRRDFRTWVDDVEVLVYYAFDL